MQRLFFLLDAWVHCVWRSNHKLPISAFGKSGNHHPGQTVSRGREKTSQALGHVGRKLSKQSSCLITKINMAPPRQCLEDCQRCHNWFNLVVVLRKLLLPLKVYSLSQKIARMACQKPHYHIIIFEGTSVVSITSQLPVTYTDGNYFPNNLIIATRSNLYLKKL